MSADDHGHHHHHDHDHDHDHGHAHAPPQPDDKVHSYYQILGIALKELLIEKGVVTAAEVRKQIEHRDSITPANGSKVVARAWTDPAFKKRLFEDGNRAVAELGFQITNTKLVAVENTEAEHNVVVCTLCSCYPRDLLGLPPSWYKSRAYRARVVREPRATFSLEPDEPGRPACSTPLPGLWLAGDWTDTGLPATIEGAVRSGHRAADELLTGGTA